MKLFQLNILCQKINVFSKQQRNEDDVQSAAQGDEVHFASIDSPTWLYFCDYARLACCKILLRH